MFANSFGNYFCHNVLIEITITVERSYGEFLGTQIITLLYSYFTAFNYNTIGIYIHRLSAFVLKSFHQAKQHIYVEDNIIFRIVDWMKRYQNSDGSFRQVGTVHSTSLRVNIRIFVNIMSPFGVAKTVIRGWRLYVHVENSELHN